MGQSPAYLPGYSQQERNRLALQSAILRPSSERFFRAAGLAPGLRVLDVGCGIGDLTILAAEIVGSTGSVVGLDRDSKSLEQAAAAAAALSGVRVEFVQSEFDKFAPTDRFDAVIGRYVLMHQRDPVSMLRRIATSLVKPDGGVVAFHEYDLTWLTTNAPLIERMQALISQVMVQEGAHPDIGRRLTRLFLDAGLPRPIVQAELLVGGEPGSFLFPWIAQSIAVMSPLLIKAGLVRAEEVEIGALMASFDEEAAKYGSQVVGPIQFGASSVLQAVR